MLKMRVVAVRAAMALGTLVVALLSGAADDGVPDRFADRPVLPDCGRAVSNIMQAEPVGAAVDCFDAALAAGRAAELVVDVTTVEGDPVTLYYRALPDGGMEMFDDSREDGFGSGGWSYNRCPEARSFGAWGPCESRRLS
jgi:hypothetical protein